MQRVRQMVTVLVSLAGPQETSVVAHRPGTHGAAVSVRVGGALLYLNDAATVSRLAQIWSTSGNNVAQQLPGEADVTKGTWVGGMADPAVMVEATEATPVFARLERPAGRPSHLRVTVGRIMFDVRDLVAFRTTAMAFRLAETYAATAFLPAPVGTARARAAEAAGRAFAAPATAGNRPLAATQYPRVYPRVALVPPRSTERRVR